MEQPTCAICLDGSNNENPLFNPCDCKGTISYCRKCIEHIISEKRMMKCGVCKTNYSVEPIISVDYKKLFILLFRILGPLVWIRRCLITIYDEFIKYLDAFYNHNTSNVNPSLLYDSIICIFAMAVMYDAAKTLIDRSSKLKYVLYKFTPVNKMD
jgi:hypothetical protein